MHFNLFFASFTEIPKSMMFNLVRYLFQIFALQYMKILIEFEVLLGVRI